MSEPLLLVNDIYVKRDSTEILRGVSIKVDPDEIVGILGRNGAGKSTLAYALMGIPSYIPIKGRVLFCKEDITEYDITRRARMGLTLAWQQPARYEGISVRDYLRLSKPTASEADLIHALSMVQMEASYLQRMTDKSLSGGERKRIELASVYLMKPKLAILDEPDSGVDLLALAEIMNLFRVLAENGSSVLIITHREDVASQCDRSYLMCNGQIILEGRAEAVKRYFLSQCEPCADSIPEETGEVRRRV